MKDGVSNVLVVIGSVLAKPQLEYITSSQIISLMAVSNSMVRN